MIPKHSLRAVTAAPYEPLSLSEAKLHLRIEDTATTEDTLIAGLIRAARGFAEHYTGRVFVQRTLEMRIEGFPGCELEIPRAPLQSIESVTYVDPTGTSTTWAAAEYDIDTDAVPGRLAPSYGNSYPATRYQMNAVTVRFIAGYAVGSPQDADGYRANIPDEIKSAMLMIIGHLYTNRESVSDAGLISAAIVPQGALWLLAPFRVELF